MILFIAVDIKLNKRTWTFAGLFQLFWSSSYHTSASYQVPSNQFVTVPLFFFFGYVTHFNWQAMPPQLSSHKNMNIDDI